jgi:hypothetical protein
MLDQKIIDEINRGYVCPEDAGPAWRAACDYGFDMSLVEDSLRISLEQRIQQHQYALNMILMVNAARELNEQNNSR